MTSSAEFDDIRPYQDHEVSQTIARLLRDNEFLDTVARLKMPRVSAFAAPLMRPLVRKVLQRETQGVTSVRDFQLRLTSYMQRMLDRTTTALTVVGLENLSSDNAYCFISNHRDIAVDPAIVNWVLYQNGFQTLRIAIGDNLLTKSFASDIMRLNKCFIVNRSVKAPREKLKAARTLSKYIHYSVTNDNANIWIAQREGRAKNGVDVTNPAIVSMLLLAKEKTEEFGDFLARANIVPLSISYEWDPCDVAKARELTLIKRDGHYEKRLHEDVESIFQGIRGQKGRIHLAFGEPLSPAIESVEQAVIELDKQILKNYLLQTSNCVAYERLEGHLPDLTLLGAETFTPEALESARAQMQQRIDQCDPQWRDMLLHIYANPVYAKLASKSQ
jgi:Acyltransferase